MSTPAPVTGQIVLTDFYDTGISDHDFLTRDNHFGLAMSGQTSDANVIFQISTDHGQTWQTTTEQQHDLNDGIYQFRALLTDAEGNQAATPVQVVTIKNVAPAAGTVAVTELNDTGRSDHDRITQDNSFRLTPSGQEANSSFIYQISTDSGKTWTDTTAEQNDLADGHYNYKIMVIDALGHPAEIVFQSVKVDTTAPVIDLLSTDSATYVTGQAEAGTFVTINDAVGNVLVQDVRVGSTGEFSATLSRALVSGEMITAVAEDIAGNVSNAVEAEYSYSNTDPVATDNLLIRSTHGDPVDFSLVELLANDSDAENDTLTITHINGNVLTGADQQISVNGGVLDILADGTIVFTPETGYWGTTSFSYEITDGHSGYSSAVVSIDVFNSHPVATDNLLIRSTHGDPVDFSLSELLSNDSDAEDDTLTITHINGQTLTGGNQQISISGGVLDISADGTIIFTPETGYWGAAPFSYEITDGHGGYASAMVSIDVFNSPPVANDNLLIRSTHGDPVDFSLSELLSNDSDAEDDTLTITHINGQILTGVNQQISISGGVLDISADGTIIFTPEIGYWGAAPFSYEITDGHGGYASAMVSIDVFNSPPVANDNLLIRSTHGDPVDFSLSELLSNDSDAEDDTLTITHINGQTLTGVNQQISISGGVLDISADGTIIFTPETGYWGVAPFSYEITDGHGGYASAMVSIDVTLPTATLIVDLVAIADTESGIEEVENPDAATIRGTTTNIAAGELINLTITDSISVIDVLATVQVDGSYEVTDIDLSNLEGDVTVTAEYEGYTATDTETITRSVINDPILSSLIVGFDLQASTVFVEGMTDFADTVTVTFPDDTEEITVPDAGGYFLVVRDYSADPIEFDNVRLEGGFSALASNAVGSSQMSTQDESGQVQTAGTNADEQVIGRTAMDTFEGNGGSDTMIFRLLDGLDSTGGNGAQDVWADFHVGDVTTDNQADKIDLSQLLVDYTGIVQDYISITQSGSDILLNIDRDGAGLNYDTALLLTLNNVTTTLDDLINNGQLIV